MRASAPQVLLLAVLVVAAGPAESGVLTNATWFQVTHGVPMTRTFSQLAATGTSSGDAVSVKLSYPQVQTTVFRSWDQGPTRIRFVDLGIQVSQGGTQAITATAGMAGGTPGIPGTLLVMTAAHRRDGNFRIGRNTVVKFPLSVGRDGQFNGTFAVLGVLHFVRADFQSWTPGTFMATGLTSRRVPLPNVTAAGSFNLTPSGGGTVTLVSPSKVSIDGLFSQRRTAAFSTLKLSFAPGKVTICHKQDRTLSVGVISLPGHLAHGDRLGACH